VKFSETYHKIIRTRQASPRFFLSNKVNCVGYSISVADMRAMALKFPRPRELHFQHDMKKLAEKFSSNYTFVSYTL